MPAEFAFGKPRATAARGAVDEPQSAPGVGRRARRHRVVRADRARLDVPSRPDDVNQEGRTVAGRPAARRVHPLGAVRPAGHRAVDRCRRVLARDHAARQARTDDRARPGRRRAARAERLHRVVRRRPDDGRRLLRLRRPVPAVERQRRPPLRLHALRVVGRSSRRHRPRHGRRGPHRDAGPHRCGSNDHRTVFAERRPVPRTAAPARRRDRAHRRPSRRDGLEPDPPIAGTHRHPAERERPRAGRSPAGRARRRADRGDPCERPVPRAGDGATDRHAARAADPHRRAPARTPLRRARRPDLPGDRRGAS